MAALGAALCIAAVVGPAGGHGHEWEELNLDRAPAGITPPGFDLVDLSGRVVRLAALRGRPVLLNFWATWCAPCEMEMPALERISRSFGPDGLAVVAINFKEPAARVLAFSRERDLTFPIVLDLDGAVAGLYQVETLPFSLLLGRSGEILAAAEGPRNWASPAAKALFERLAREGAPGPGQGR
jgi:thiol-disulfide isomerase/thioredoxin